MSNKRYVRRQGRKRALRTSDATREPMSASRRLWGRGAGSNAKVN